MELIYRELSQEILRACMLVHSELGCGLFESVYSDALEYEFKELQIPYKRELDVRVIYKSIPMDRYFRIDYLCYDKIILELKAVDTILPIHKVQLINYLKLSRHRLGFVINFGCPSLQWERIANIY